ncbi:MAG: response regulator [Verrucomicrobiota bacterium]
MSHLVPSQRILVVDDEPLIRESLEMVLIFGGHTVEAASGGPEALQKLAQQKFDIVFTDRKMLQMSGDELARFIKKKYPLQVIVMATAYPFSLDPGQGKATAIDFIITKPFGLEILGSAVRRAHEINLENRKLAR